ncbi:ImmA/IrrE family metallo-endopeptidase [Hymenobacter sp. BT18]|uniref:ImmA/IrrE family metallo-endopeptidase n=1 Tax=Hymenobacter sp. BT18 TaxID=2835648 RepID=UPI00143E9C62|nr:ImmA/IrrE family metallo-endopeptidase [Hymenobacter sp. BT18]QIX61876.1 ImmA/IrrE family metallo-endopeptidase [Hymenobacter sp. BT18]
MQQDKPSLKELFDRKVQELDLPVTAACKLIGVQHRSVKGLLTGEQKIVDITTLIKLAEFLQVPQEEVVQLYMQAVQQHNPVTTMSLQKIEFIKANFDLAALKKAGLINSLSDYEHIENRITKRLGLKSILEYKKPNGDVAFSSGVFNPKNVLTRSFWISAAIACFEEIDNPFPYSREGLINIFPKLKRYSTNVDLGLKDVVKLLYKVGITVVYQPPMAGLKLRGATFNHRGKPCIVLTDYKGFYPTLWFALVHELYHVLFDWEEIKTMRYHLTDDTNDEVSVREREQMADMFAREYLFSRDKTKEIKRYIHDSEYIREIAEENHIHPSIIYAMNAFDLSGDGAQWAKVRLMSPPFETTIKNINAPLDDDTPIEQLLHGYKTAIKF